MPQRRSGFFIGKLHLSFEGVAFRASSTLTKPSRDPLLTTSGSLPFARLLVTLSSLCGLTQALISNLQPHTHLIARGHTP